MRETATAEPHVAQRPGMEVDRFGELFGAGWRPVEPFAQRGLFDETWYVAGEPPQLALALAAQCLPPRASARARGCRHDVAELRLEPMDERTLPHGADDEAHSLVADLLRRRRSTFRYCPYCRGLTRRSCGKKAPA